MKQQYFTPEYIRTNQMKLPENKGDAISLRITAVAENFNNFLRHFIPDLNFRSKHITDATKEANGFANAGISQSAGRAKSFLQSAGVMRWKHRIKCRIKSAGNVFYEWMDGFVLMEERRDSTEGRRSYAETADNDYRGNIGRFNDLFQHMAKAGERFLLKADRFLFGSTPVNSSYLQLEIVNPGAVSVLSSSHSLNNQFKTSDLVVIFGFVKYFIKNGFAKIPLFSATPFSPILSLPDNKPAFTSINLLWCRYGWGFT